MEYFIFPPFLLLNKQPAFFIIFFDFPLIYRRAKL